MKRRLNNRVIILALLILTPALAICKGGSKIDKEFKKSIKIEKSIKRTSFPAKSYNIEDFGAVKESKDKPAHIAINKAIELCSEKGGGSVIVPKGTYYCGPITLKSNVNLHFEDGAVLKFLTDPDLYFPAVLTRWEGLDCYNTHPLIYANGETNIAITGKGIIDGQATNDNWWAMCGAPAYGWKPGMIAQRNGGREKLLAWAEMKVPVEERRMVKEDGMRPQLINFIRCNTILIEGVTLLNSPFWVIHPLFCKNLVVSGVDIFNRGPNGDGCDPESSSNILIEGCKFDTGDDCIAIKSGRNEDGRRWKVPSENIVVKDCLMKNGHGGLVIGSEISGGAKNIFIENCKMDSPQLDRVVRIKTSTCRGGVVEKVYARNIEVGECKEAVLRINLRYEERERCNRGFTPIVRDVHLDNITCQKSEYGIKIIGLEKPDYVYNINVTNCSFNNVKSGGNDIKGAKDVNISNLLINGKPSK